MRNQNRSQKTPKIVLGLGMANALILTFSPDPIRAASSPSPQRTSPGTKEQLRQIVNEEQVNVVQTEARLSVKVSGNPGRHLGIFWGETPSLASFKLIPGMSAQIGTTRSAELVLNLASLRSRRFFIQLVCADDPDFRNSRTLTEAVEVRVRPQGAPLIAGSDASGKLSKSVQALSEPNLIIKAVGRMIITLPDIQKKDQKTAGDLFPND